MGKLALSFSLGLATLLAAALAQPASAQSYVHRYHGLRHVGGIHRHVHRHYRGIRHYGIGHYGIGHYGISRYGISRYKYGVHSHLHRHYYRTPITYTNRYHRFPSYYSGYSPYHHGRVISPYYRRGPSTVSFYFNALPIYRPTFYHRAWHAYPIRRTYYYDATLCYPFSYSASRVYTRSTSPTLLLPPPRLTTGDSLLTSFASTTAPSADIDTAYTSLTSASLERLRMSRHTTAGDAYFGAGRYLEAVNSYSDAIEGNPTESEGLFRLGHALVAVGQYETAIRAFKSALTLSKDPTRDRFQLRELYGDDNRDMSGHMEKLAKYVLAKPDNADALWLVGVMLHYDGQKARAYRFFDKASRLDGRSEHIRKMLDASTLAET